MLYDVTNVLNFLTIIRQVITPEEITNPNVDERSVMTYVSYFPEAKLKPGAPLRPKTRPWAKWSAKGPGVEPKGLDVEKPANFKNSVNVADVVNAAGDSSQSGIVAFIKQRQQRLNEIRLSKEKDHQEENSLRKLSEMEQPVKRMEEQLREKDRELQNLERLLSERELHLTNFQRQL